MCALVPQRPFYTRINIGALPLTSFFFFPLIHCFPIPSPSLFFPVSCQLAGFVYGVSLLGSAHTQRRHFPFSLHPPIVRILTDLSPPSPSLFGGRFDLDIYFVLRGLIRRFFLGGTVFSLPFRREEHHSPTPIFSSFPTMKIPPSFKIPCHDFGFYSLNFPFFFVFPFFLYVRAF